MGLQDIETRSDLNRTGAAEAREVFAGRGNTHEGAVESIGRMPPTQFQAPTVTAALVASDADDASSHLHNAGASVPPTGRLGLVKGGAAEAEMATLAEALRIKMLPHLVGMKAVMDEALSHGLSMDHRFGIGPSGRHVIGPIQVVKHL